MPAPKVREAGQRARILVVEDEPLVRIALAEDLRTAGFVVVEAASAEEGLARLQAARDIDLVFTDIEMPGSLDGLGLSRRCRQIFPDLPVILTSGATEPQKLEGASKFMPKPCSPRAAVQAVRELLAPTPRGAGE